MKNKRFANIIWLLLLTGGLIATARAQQGEIWFPNGVAVIIKTEPNDKNFGYANIYASAGTDKNVVQRILIDRKSKIYFGYDLEIMPTGDAKQFDVLVKPLSGDNIRETVAKIGGSNDFIERSLPNYPNKIIIQSGDTIKLDILENPQTKERISDSIKVTQGKQKNTSYSSLSSDRKEPRDFTVNDINLSLNGFEVYVNDQKVKFAGGGMSGSVIWIYFPNKGRFIFSPVEQPNSKFQKIGTIDDKTMTFNYEGASYKLVSTSSVLGQDGKWNLWVMFDENYRPAEKLTATTPFSFGAADKVEYLFDNK